MKAVISHFGYRGLRQRLANRLFPSPAKIRLLRELKREIKNREGPLIDVGCAQAKYRHEFGRHDYLGIDINLELLRSTTILSKADGVLLVCGDAKAIPLTQESVGIVVSTHTLFYFALADLRSFIDESLRVLKPSGLLVAHITKEQFDLSSDDWNSFSNVRTYGLRSKLSLRMENFWHSRVGVGIWIPLQAVTYLVAYVMSFVEGNWRWHRDLLVIADRQSFGFLDREGLIELRDRS